MAPATPSSIRVTRRRAGTAHSGGRSRLIRSTARRRNGSAIAPATRRRFWTTGASTPRTIEGDNLLGSYLFTPLDVETLNANMRLGAVRVGAYVPNPPRIQRPPRPVPG